MLHRLRAGMDSNSHLGAGLPVHAALEPLVGRTLLPGAAYSVGGGSLLLALLAEPSKAGSWCAVVGIPELGIEAARNAGIRLERLILVPDPGRRWLLVVAALAEAASVVAVKPATRVKDEDALRLAARFRDRSTVLLSCADWPRPQAKLSIAQARWSGLQAGHGYLESREVVVQATTRAQGMPRSARMILPDASGALAEYSAPFAEQTSSNPRLQVVE